MFVRKPLRYMTDTAPVGSGETPPPADSGGSGTTPPTPPKGDEGKTFTQAELERIIAGRLSKFSDYDQIQKELADLRAAGQSEAEKVAEKAAQEARTEGRREAAADLAREVFNGLAGRRNKDFDTGPALDLIDLGKFVKDDGTVDRAAVQAAVDTVVPEAKNPPPPNYGGGPRGGSDKPEPTPGMGRLRAAYAQPTK